MSNKELRCSESVKNILLDLSKPTEIEQKFSNSISLSLLGIPVQVDSDLKDGEWVFTDDHGCNLSGVVNYDGTLYQYNGECAIGQDQ